MLSIASPTFLGFQPIAQWHSPTGHHAPRTITAQAVTGADLASWGLTAGVGLVFATGLSLKLGADEVAALRADKAMRRPAKSRSVDPSSRSYVRCY